MHAYADCYVWLITNSTFYPIVIFILDWKKLVLFIIVDSTIFCALDINCSLSNCDKVAVHCVKIKKIWLGGTVSVLHTTV